MQINFTQQENPSAKLKNVRICDSHSECGLFLMNSTLWRSKSTRLYLLEYFKWFACIERQLFHNNLLFFVFCYLVFLVFSLLSFFSLFLSFSLFLLHVFLHFHTILFLFLARLVFFLHSLFFSVNFWMYTLCHTLFLILSFLVNVSLFVYWIAQTVSFVVCASCVQNL